MNRLKDMNLQTKMMFWALGLLLVGVLVILSGIQVRNEVYQKFKGLIIDIGEVQYITELSQNVLVNTERYLTSGNEVYMERVEQDKAIMNIYMEKALLEDRDTGFQIYYMNNYAEAFFTRGERVTEAFDNDRGEAAIAYELSEMKLYQGFLADYVDEQVNGKVVFARSQMAELEAQLNQREQVFRFVVVIILLFSVAISVLFSHRVTQPLRDLAETMAYVADGHMTYEKRDLSIKGDVGRLIHRSYAMLDKMIQYVEDEKEKANLEKAKEIAEQSEKAKSRLLANMSHEIRTPLNAVIGYSQILIENSQLEVQDRAHVESILDSSRHLLNLVNNILDMSKLDAHKVQIAEEETNIRQLVAASCSLFTLPAEKKNLHFSVICHDDVPGTLHIDKYRIKQIIINLVNNAVKFTDHGSVKVAVAYEQDSVMTLEVSDTGTGIDPEKHETIFNVFEQTEVGSDPKIGTGLGLAISRQLARLMGGDIQVVSQVGEGAAFILKVPCKKGMKEAGQASGTEILLETEQTPQKDAEIELDKVMDEATLMAFDQALVLGDVEAISAALTSLSKTSPGEAAILKELFDELNLEKMRGLLYSGQNA